MLNIHSVIFAAGKGSRMHSSLPKVLQPLANKPLLAYVLDCAKQCSNKQHIICGYQQDLIKQAFAKETINWVEQTEQLGTAHALTQAMPYIDSGIVLVLYGDVPLIKAKTLQKLCDIAKQKRIALLSIILDNPTGYGRIVRDDNNNIQQIIEQKDANIQTLNINEVNTGIMAVQAELLHQYLPKINNNNTQNEWYLTDLIGLLTQNNITISGLICQDEVEVMGVNDKRQLANLERIYQQKIAHQLMEQGLTLIDPNRFDCRGKLSFGCDCSVDINVIIQGEVSLGNGVIIEANCIIKNSSIGNNSIIYANSIIENSIIEQGVKVGPFARLRPQTQLKENSKIGNFVETKKSTIGIGSKVSHLSYIGDTNIGKNSNIGAGVITCNYDGVNKHQTQIGDNVFIGSNSALVAPIDIGDQATIGAGSTLTKNAPNDQLTLSRVKQLSLKNWQKLTLKKPLHKSK